MSGTATLADDGDVEGLKMCHDWVAALETSNGRRRVCSRENLAELLRDDILGGRLTSNSAVAVHAKTADGSWSQATLPLLGIVRGTFKLRVLYEPVWAHALAGLKWGGLAGIGLKLLDTFVRLAVADVGVGVMFLVAAGLCLVPRLGMGAMIFATIVMSRFTKLNLFFAVVGSFVAGAALGCLPGMAVGGVVGLLRRRRLHLAPDALSEGSDVALKAVALPLLGAVGVWALYGLVIVPALTGGR